MHSKLVNERNRDFSPTTTQQRDLFRDGLSGLLPHREIPVAIDEQSHRRRGTAQTRERRQSWLRRGQGLESVASKHGRRQDEWRKRLPVKSRRRCSAMTAQ